MFGQLFYYTLCSVEQNSAFHYQTELVVKALLRNATSCLMPFKGVSSFPMWKKKKRPATSRQIFTRLNAACCTEMLSPKLSKFLHVYTDVISCDHQQLVLRQTSADLNMKNSGNCCPATTFIHKSLLPNRMFIRKQSRLFHNATILDILHMDNFHIYTDDRTIWHVNVEPFDMQKSFAALHCLLVCTFFWWKKKKTKKTGNSKTNRVFSAKLSQPKENWVGREYRFSHTVLMITQGQNSCTLVEFTSQCDLEAHHVWTL